MGYPSRVANAKDKFYKYLGKGELPTGRVQDMVNQATGVGMMGILAEPGTDSFLLTKPLSEFLLKFCFNVHIGFPWNWTIWVKILGWPAFWL